MDLTFYYICLVMHTPSGLVGVCTKYSRKIEAYAYACQHGNDSTQICVYSCVNMDMVMHKTYILCLHIYNVYSLIAPRQKA